MVMSNVQWFVIGAVFTAGLVYVCWFVYEYLGGKGIFLGFTKRKQIGVAMEILKYCKFLPEEIKIGYFIQYKITDPVVIRLAEEKLKKLEVKKNGNNKVSAGERSEPARSESNGSAGVDDVARQRGVSEGVVEQSEGASKYFC